MLKHTATLTANKLRNLATQLLDPEFRVTAPGRMSLSKLLLEHASELDLAVAEAEAPVELTEDEVERYLAYQEGRQLEPGQE